VIPNYASSVFFKYAEIRIGRIPATRAYYQILNDYQSQTPIDRITLLMDGSAFFQSGSSVWLYGR
jgi:hypothetical protein